MHVGVDGCVNGVGRDGVGLAHVAHSWLRLPWCTTCSLYGRLTRHGTALHAQLCLLVHAVLSNGQHLLNHLDESSEVEWWPLRYDMASINTCGMVEGVTGVTHALWRGSGVDTRHGCHLSARCYCIGLQTSGAAPACRAFGVGKGCTNPRQSWAERLQGMGMMKTRKAERTGARGGTGKSLRLVKGLTSQVQTKGSINATA